MPRQLTILIADDYADALDVWAVYLRGQGFAVLAARDGREALRLATASLPDAAVLDLEMPGLSGGDVARALRAMDATRTMPLVAATGTASPRQLADAQQAGFDLVLAKPCDPGRLVAELHRLVAVRAARTRLPHTLPLGAARPL